jgi:hypothetical protein
MNPASQHDSEFLDDLTLHLIRNIALAVQAGVDGDTKRQQQIIERTEQHVAHLWPSRIPSITKH